MYVKNSLTLWLDIGTRGRQNKENGKEGCERRMREVEVRKEGGKEGGRERRKDCVHS